MTGLALALLAGAGVYLLWSAPARTSPTGRARWWAEFPHRFEEWLTQAGLGEVRPATFVATVVLFGAVGAALGSAALGGVATAAVAGLATSLIPVMSYRARRQRAQAAARDAWPRIIEELRIATGSMGRSVPQAVVDVTATVPPPMRPAFEAAAREWRMSTDFGRTLSVLQRSLADPTADAACETLLVAHEVGGADLDRRLRALAEDRMLDLQGRKDAAAKQAGVRFARRFVVIVPLGMAVAGMSIGTGRAAYATATGQLAVVIGVALMAACWVWAGHYMRLPDEQRVFRGDERAARLSGDGERR